MSIKLMSVIWDDPPVAGSKLLVLLALADSANDEGLCWPSVQTIARKCALSDRQVERVVKALEGLSLLQTQRRQREDGSYRSNLYVVLPQKTGYSVTDDTRGSDTHVTRDSDTGDTQNHNIESSVKNPRLSENKKRFQTDAERGSAPVPDAVALEQEDDPPLEEVKSLKNPGPPRAEQNTLRRAVREHFCKRTGLKPPSGDGEGHRREVATLWWGPIREICELAGWDERRALRLLDEALKEMEGLTVSDPHSVIKTARAIAARTQRQERGFEATLDKIRRRSEQDRLDSEARERRRDEYRKQEQASSG